MYIVDSRDGYHFEEKSVALNKKKGGNSSACELINI